MTDTDIPRGRRQGRSRTEGMSSRLPVQRPFAQPRMTYHRPRSCRPTSSRRSTRRRCGSSREIGMDVLDPGAREPCYDGRRRRRRPSTTVTLRPGDGRRPDQDRAGRVHAALVEPRALAPHRRRLAGVRHGRQSAPNSCDLDRRPAHRQPRRLPALLLRLAQMLNSIHFVGGYPVEPIDVHASVRHLHAGFDVLTLTDKRLPRATRSAGSATST